MGDIFFCYETDICIVKRIETKVPLFHVQMQIEIFKVRKGMVEKRDLIALQGSEGN